MPLAPFNQMAIRQSEVFGEQPYEITLLETLSGEEWTLDLPADRGSLLANYLRAQQAAGQTYDRQQIITLLSA